METEEALWKAVGANPSDSLPRLVLADFLEENATSVRCEACGGAGYRSVYERGEYGPNHYQETCPACKVSGYTPCGRAALAAALRGTVGRVPLYRHGEWRWRRDGDGSMRAPYRVPKEVWAELGRGRYGNEYRSRWKPFPTAESALRDLCRAWCVVHAGTRATV